MFVKTKKQLIEERGAKMNENSIKMLFLCLASSFKEAPLSEEEKSLYTEDAINELLSTAKEHDITQLVYKGLYENGLVPDTDSSYKNSIFKTVFRYENQNYELSRVRSLLEKNEIPFVLLKGSVLRNYYKEPWLRTSCDIDILIKKDDLEKAKNLIIKELNYECTFVSTHDVSLMSQNRVHLELHFELMETDFKKSTLLSNVWDSSELLKISDYEYQMTNELFLFFHIYHMAKHFKYGGCGIKPLIDLWVIRNKMSYDEKKVIKLLKDEDLEKFYEYALLLTDAWLEGKSHNDVTKSMECFILQGGVYGTFEQNLAMEQGAKGGAFRRMWGRVFMPYSQMIKGYPVLKNWPILFPLFQVVRWFRIIFGAGRKRAIEEMKSNQSVTQAEREMAKSLIDELGLR